MLYLPSAGPLPRPSPDAVALGSPLPAAAGEVRLRPWSAPVLWLPVDRLTVPLWRAGAAGRAPQREALVLAPDVRWLGRVAHLAALYWMRGAVVPRVQGGRGVAAAYWLPLLDDPELRPSLEALARQMPISLLAAARPNTWAGQRNGHRWHAASALLSAMVDALARYTPTRTGAMRRPPAARLRPRRLKRQTSAWGEVARTLGSASPVLWTGGSEPLARVSDRLDAWQAPGASTGARVARLSLRLAPPTSLGARRRPSARAPLSAADRWHLEVALALLGQADRAVAVADVMADGPGAARAAERLGLSVGEMRRSLAGDLDRMRQVAPQAAAAVVRAAARGSVDLGGAETLRFLQVDGPRLRQAGFAVSVPEWWRQDARRRLRVEVATTSPGGGPSRLGLGAVAAVSWRAQAGDSTVAAADLARAVRAGGGIVAAGDGWVEVSARDARILARLLAAAPGQSGAMAERDILELFAQLGAEDGDDGAEPSDIEVQADGWLAEARLAIEEGRPVLGALAEVPLRPGDLHGTLRPYQEEGVRWLWSLASRGMGACLADDMGLGKTVEAIALIAARRRAGLCGANQAAVRIEGAGAPGAPGPAGRDGEARPVLLVCPTSVLTNWQREFARFAPDVRVGVRHGVRRSRGEAAAQELAACDVALTSYALVWRDHRILGAVDWDGVILDEAQAVKNPATRQSRAVRRLSGRFRLALTGTPIENRLLDLWAIFQFLNPGYLGSPERFRRRFGQPIEERGDAQASRALHRLVAPFILRRLKTDPHVLADLPPKVEMRELCALTREQARLYEAVVEDMLRRVARLDGLERRGVVATALLRLKQVLNHPSHFLGDPGPFRPERSGKVVRVGQIVEEALDEGDRLLLFTQFVAFGHMLRPYLERLCGQAVPFLHGSLARAERDRAIAAFQASGGPPLFLLSLKAGGVGLNLTRANRVLHLDRWWNPAVEEQATDRAHRIGQRERVMVHKLVVAGTIEERVDALLQEKRDLAARVVGTAGEGWIADLDDEALADLVRLRAVEVET